ncbi:hypothetical protein BS78_05G033700 [Paspalum vaginatum]|nr:hypothetical protein BS78_05G033700 [Paspalum vaginatum]
MMENCSLSVPENASHIPTPKDQWLELVPEAEMDQVRALLANIDTLKKGGLTAMAIAIDFVHHKIQPLKDRVHPAFLYSGIDDPTREGDQPVGEEEVLFRMSQFFTGEVTNIKAPKSLSVYHPPVEKRAAKYQSHPPLPEGLHLKSNVMADEDVAESIISRLDSESCPANFFITIGQEPVPGGGSAEHSGAEAEEGPVQEILGVYEEDARLKEELDASQALVLREEITMLKGDLLATRALATGEGYRQIDQGEGSR